MAFWRRTREYLKGRYRAGTTRLGNLFRPRGADKVVRILHGLATIDDQLDDRELAFIRAFAKRWGFDPEDAFHAPGPAHPVEAHAFTALRDAMADYLAMKPPVDQANQLRDVLTSLVTIDGRLCEREELMLEELGRMIDGYAGGPSAADYVVLIAPRDEAERNAVSDALPGFEREPRPGGEVFRVGQYHSETYAELVSGWYRDAGYRTLVEEPH